MTKEQKFYKVLQDIFVGAKIEAGAAPNPTIETVKKIADAIGVSLDDLMK